jgi:hypothetical protein
MLSFALIGKLMQSQEQNGSIHPSASNQIIKINLQPEALVVIKELTQRMINKNPD